MKFVGQFLKKLGDIKFELCFGGKKVKITAMRPIRVVFNQACKYASTVTKFCKGEVISPFFVLLFEFNMVTHIIFKKE